MTEEKKPIYLTKEIIKIIHQEVCELFKDEEPVPPFEFANQKALESLINTPQQKIAGKELYPSIAEKAAILFYSLNKQQIFLNGNKRMSVACLLVFLRINNKRLNVDQDQLVQKSLWLAISDTLAFQDVKKDLVQWINDNSIDADMLN